MEALFFIGNVSSFSPIAPVFVGLYFFRRLDRSLKFLVLYLLIALGIDALAIYLGSVKHLNNHWLINIYWLIEYSFLAYIFSLWHVDRVKVWLRISIVSYALVWTYMNFIYSSLTTFDNFSVSLSSSLLVGIALYTLLLFQNDQSNRSLRAPQFWVAAIVLISFGGKLLVNIFEPTLQTWTIRNILTIFTTLTYAWGLLWISRKSILGH